MSESQTPDFQAPPVVETVLGVEFAPLESWNVPHFGLYWAEIRSRYPKIADQPPLISSIEQLGPNSANPPTLTLPMFGGGTMGTRSWFIDESERRLIQVQNGRFIVNWRKVDDSDQYPHYPALREDFEEEWNRFRRFLEGHSLGEPRVVQCEVTYVNNVVRGEGWESFADLGQVIAPWSGRHSGRFLPPEESVALNVRYLLPNNRGRLHVVLNRALRTTDAKEAIQLNLTARGAPASSSTSDILAWIDMGRDWVVRGFTDFTSETMHRETWRRIR
jgi:uncharacterized protein (TIGR04255 family)